MLRSARSTAFFAAVIAAGLLPVAGVLTDPLAPSAAAQDGQAAPELARPTRHFRVERPAELSDADAISIYDRILDDMVASYRLSRLPYTETYRTWRRYNTVPYLSSHHGNRYLNNYGNVLADAYGKYEDVGTLPAGAVVVKDSFAVTDRGDVFTGPLFVMEKMAPGFNPAGRDWRYTMIMPDGSLFGTTNGDGAARVEFCVTCHQAAGDKQDHLFFLPQEYRRRFLGAPADP